MSRIQAFNESALARQFSKKDFYNDCSLSDNEYRKNVVEKAVEESDRLFPDGIIYNCFFLGKKKSFSLSSLSQRLVVRTCVSYLKRSFAGCNKSRSKIARELRVFLADGTPYNIYRLDIKSFFENIQKEELERKVQDIPALSMHTKKIIKRMADYFYEVEGVCVPRGIETSSILSDLYLKDFDSYVLSRNDVFFYSRFVDDILIVASNECDAIAFQEDVTRALPKGLFFNSSKTEIKVLCKRKKAGSIYYDNDVAQFDFLGFRFVVADSPLPTKINGGVEVENGDVAPAVFRKVKVDLSPSKIKRIKDKLCKSFYSYGKTGDFLLLKDRVRFLSTNREFVKKDNSSIMPVGIYYNNSACDFPSLQLAHIDKFMRFLLFGNDKRLPKIYAGSLSLRQKQELLKFNFSYGFINRPHKRFSHNRLAEIVRIWK
ncbi:MAG: RNA-directed DNA polymerase [Marinospirillum sp.]|uniref:antiviral reverse transcriptase Drt3a n=1 Tax=Marinospirillum sp. TaxID=2183934 RepID=UPI0019F3717B|nr:antiviral reverse transcriptase Drt3a [Marinospirillum sp.]MBE0507244.1 RNA-directed DNA polymerase [Marinospirillum sp.]